MSVSCGENRGGRRRLATRGFINSYSEGGRFHIMSNGTAFSGGGVLRRDRSVDKRPCCFGPYSKFNGNETRTQNINENLKRHTIGEHVTTPDDFNIRITNMHYGVSATDLKDLFGKFGPLKRVTVYYDRYGRTLGTADVVFHNKNAAEKAVFQYNNAQFYGRPMNLELTTVSSTVANHAARISIPDRVIHVGDDNGIQRNRGITTHIRSNSKISGGRGHRRTKRKIPSKEELDAQLDCIMNNIK